MGIKALLVPALLWIFSIRLLDYSETMKTFTLLGLIGLAGLAWARQCQNISVPVTISAVNAQFNIKTPATNIEVTDLVLNLTQLGKNFPGSITTGVSRTTLGKHIR